MSNSAAMAGDARLVKELGVRAGFDLVRITSASPLHEERARYLAWLAEGRQAGMKWMTSERATVSSAPDTVLASAKSVVCVGLSYWAGHREQMKPGNGKIARYAWGRDYHAVLGDGLEKLAHGLREAMGGEHRWYVDTGPMMDKALAARSGLGWYGKNTNILTPEFGSYALLGEILTTLELVPDEPLRRDCGTCRLCAVACPTKALRPDYTIDAGKCISYLTIEHRGAIPMELRSAMGSWVFGCDICQDVCPPTMLPHLGTRAERRAWSREVRQVVAGDADDARVIPEPDSTEPAPANTRLFPDEIRQSFDLRQLLHLSHLDYLERFRGTAIRRAKVWMLRRNAAIALGNTGTEEDVADLTRALTDDEHPIVRGHAAWALGQIARRGESRLVLNVLLRALDTENDASVRVEVDLAIAGLVVPVHQA